VEFLIVIEPASGGRYEHRVAPGSYVLGREEASCDIAILSPEVSRQHARIHLSAEQCTVEDLGSMAGTSKDGQALDGKQSCKRRSNSAARGGRKVRRLVDLRIHR
jgi:pSer/pThr/pTyr-binding forkhead associated (FHA) protein